MSPENREKDKKMLIEILVHIEDRLHYIVYEPPEIERTDDARRKSRFRKEFLELLPGPWEQVAMHLRRSRDMIQNDEVDWEYVEGIGLTGKMLEWKVRMFRETLRQNVVGRFFKVANSLLGSLSKVIPPLELVKEYKEHVEAAMKYVR